MHADNDSQKLIKNDESDPRWQAMRNQVINTFVQATIGDSEHCFGAGDVDVYYIGGSGDPGFASSFMDAINKMTYTYSKVHAGEGFVVPVRDHAAQKSVFFIGNGPTHYGWNAVEIDLGENPPWSFSV